MASLLGNGRLETEWFDAVMDDDVEKLEELLKREPGLMRERFSGAAYDDGVKQMAEAVLGRTVGPLTALQLACLYESESAAEWLLQRLPVSAVDDTWGDGCTTLHLAAFHAMVATVAGLLERGARAGVRNGVGFVPVDCAADDETRNTFLAAAARAPPPIRSQRSLTQLVGAPPTGTTVTAATTASTAAVAAAPARDVAEEAPAETANKQDAPRTGVALTAAGGPAAAAAAAAAAAGPVPPTAKPPPVASRPPGLTLAALEGGSTQSLVAAAGSPTLGRSPRQDPHMLDVGRTAPHWRKRELPAVPEISTAAPAPVPAPLAKTLSNGPSTATPTRAQTAPADPSTPSPMLTQHRRTGLRDFGMARRQSLIDHDPGPQGPTNTTLARAEPLRAPRKQGWTDCICKAGEGSRVSYVRVQLRRFIKDGTYTVNMATITGITPLHFACEIGSLPVAEFLVAEGADVNAYDNSGVRPLHTAVVYEKVDLVRFLLSKGANPWLRTIDGETALDVAEADDLRTALQDAMDKTMDPYLSGSGEDSSDEEDDDEEPSSAGSAGSRLRISKRRPSGRPANGKDDA